MSYVIADDSTWMEEEIGARERWRKVEKRSRPIELRQLVTRGRIKLMELQRFSLAVILPELALNNHYVPHISNRYNHSNCR